MCVLVCGGVTGFVRYCVVLCAKCCLCVALCAEVYFLTVPVFIDHSPPAPPLLNLATADSRPGCLPTTPLVPSRAGRLACFLSVVVCVPVRSVVVRLFLVLARVGLCWVAFRVGGGVARVTCSLLVISWQILISIFSALPCPSTKVLPLPWPVLTLPLPPLLARHVRLSARASLKSPSGALSSRSACLCFNLQSVRLC